MPVFSLAQALEIELPTVEILDVGAMDEGEDRYDVLRSMGLANVTGVEPNEEQYAKLQNTENRSGSYLPYFLGTGEKQTFNLTRYPGCSSLYRPDPRVIDPFTSIGTSENGNFRVVKTMEVQTHQLNDVSQCPLPDYVKLDVQGGELDILKHGMEKLKNTLVIETEVEFVALYENQPLFGDIQVFLREHGFCLHKFVDIAGRSFKPFARDNNRYAATSQLLWADAIFVKDFKAFEIYTDEQLLKSALILHQLYFSYDLVHLILRHYDSRSGSSLNEKYLQALQSHPDLPSLYMNLKEHI
jgi:FkbM family methyltransferase